MFVTNNFEENKTYVFMISQFGLTALSGTYVREFNGMVEFSNVITTSDGNSLLPNVTNSNIRVRKDDIISYSKLDDT